MAERELSLRRESKGIALGRLAAFRLESRLRLFLPFRCKFLCHGLLQLFRIHSVAFGGVHQNVVAAGGGPLIGRVQQADFEEELAKFGLVIGAHLLGQKLLCGRGVLLYLHLMPLRQSRDLAIGKMANQVVGNRQQVALLQRSRDALEDRSQDAMASRNGQFLLFDALALLGSLALDLLRRRRVGGGGGGRGIGTNFDDLPALATVHDDGLSYLVAWFLVRG